MAKSLSGVTTREGTNVTIGDNRYGLREVYDAKEMQKTLAFYKGGGQLTVKEVKNPLTQTVKTVKVNANRT
jgi:DNA-directed RNA polymerase delta subunit